MRVGANARQFARIKRMHKEGTPAGIIAKTIQMTEQSLEKILAHLDGRKEKHLATEENKDVQDLRLQNAELAARLAKYEDPQDGENTISTEDGASQEDGEEENRPSDEDAEKAQDGA